MEDLIGWLRHQVAEDERVACAATPGPWRINDAIYPEAIYAADGSSPVAGGRWGDEGSVFDTPEDAIHIARWDPSRVLAEVKAKRRILDLLEDRTAAETQAVKRLPEFERSHVGAMVGPEINAIYARAIIRALAQPYAGRPGWREEWAA